jgi:periplasmic protein TonB
MRVFMAGPYRINLPGLLCSCVGQAIILGGILYGLLDLRHEPLGGRDISAPLTLTFEPLRAESSPAESKIGAPRAAAVHAHAPNARRPLPPVLVVATGKPMPNVAVERRQAPPSAGSEAEHGAASVAEYSDYQRRLYQAVANSSRYPAEARRQHLSGLTRVAFTLDRAGRVLESWIQDSSGSRLLDEAALDALDRAQPLPAIPLGLPSRLDFIIEIDLSVSRQDTAVPAGRS